MEKIEVQIKINATQIPHNTLDTYENKLKYYISNKQNTHISNPKHRQHLLHSKFIPTLVAPQCYYDAINQLQYNPQKVVSILGRQQQKKQIFDYLTNSLKSGGNSVPLYISGVPGIGKTATIIEVLKQFVLCNQNKVLPIYINGMKLRNPENIYSLVLRKITRLKSDSPSIALNFLFSQPEKLPKKFKVNESIVKIIVLDEIDQLTENKSEVIYNFLQWAQNSKSKIILIGLSNTIDFSTKLKNNEKSRMKQKNIVFRVYNNAQIKSILDEKLGPKYKTLFTAISLDYISKKIANYSSDIRILMNICSKALYITSQKYKQMQRRQQAIKAQVNQKKAPIKVQLEYVKQAIEPRIEKLMINELKLCQKLLLIILFHFKMIQSSQKQQSEIIFTKFRYLLNQNGDFNHFQFRDMLKLLCNMKQMSIIKMTEINSRSQKKQSIKLLTWAIDLNIRIDDYLNEQPFSNYRYLLNNESLKNQDN